MEVSVLGNIYWFYKDCSTTVLFYEDEHVVDNAETICRQMTKTIYLQYKNKNLHDVSPDFFLDYIEQLSQLTQWMPTMFNLVIFQILACMINALKTSCRHFIFHLYTSAYRQLHLLYSFPTLERHRRGGTKYMTKIMTFPRQLLKTRVGIAPDKDVTTAIGSWDKNVHTRLIKMILRAVVFMLLPLCLSLCPSPGLGPFRVLRTELQQKAITSNKNRYKAAIIK